MSNDGNLESGQRFQLTEGLDDLYGFLPAGTVIEVLGLIDTIEGMAVKFEVVENDEEDRFSRLNSTILLTVWFTLGLESVSD
jgi:hypothetical protein